MRPQKISVLCSFYFTKNTQLSDYSDDNITRPCLPNLKSFLGYLKSIFFKKLPKEETRRIQVVGIMDSQTSPVVTTHLCEGCGQLKELSPACFYFKKDRQEYDKTCSECRRKQRRERNSSSKNQEIRSGAKNIKGDNLAARATESVGPQQEKLDTSDIFKVFSILRQWREDMKRNNNEQYIKCWKEKDHA